jgi:hypothetical protein
VSADQARQGEPTVAEQVATESAKRAEKKAAQKRTAKKAAAHGVAKVRVKMTTSSRGVKAGATRTLPKADADRLIRQGHAVKA